MLHIEMKRLLAFSDIQFSGLKEKTISDKSTPIVVHVARTGVFKGYRDGEIELTTDMFDNAIENFNAEKNPLPVYKGHADVAASMIDSPYEPECEGWILGLSRDGDDLYAMVEFSEDMQELIKAGKYKFSSIYMKPEELDRETGEDIGYRMVSLAITNQPFLDGLKAISLSNKENSNITTYLQNKETKMSKKKAIKFGAAEEAAKSEDTMDKLQEGKTMEPSGELTEDPMSLLEAAKEEINPEMDLVDFIKAVLEAYKAPVEEVVASETEEKPEEEKEESEEEVVAAETAEKEEGSEEDKKEDKKDVAMSTSIKALSLQLTALKKENAILAKKNSENDSMILSAIVDEAIMKGHLTPVERKAYLELGKTSRKSFDELLTLRGANPKVVMSRLTKEDSLSTNKFAGSEPQMTAFDLRIERAKKKV